MYNLEKTASNADEKHEILQNNIYHFHMEMFAFYQEYKQVKSNLVLFLNRENWWSQDAKSILFKKKIKFWWDQKVVKSPPIKLEHHLFYLLKLKLFILK